MSDTATTNGRGDIKVLLEAPARKNGPFTARFVNGAGELHADRIHPDDADKRNRLARKVAELHLGRRPDSGKGGADKAADELAGRIDDAILQKWQQARRETTRPAEPVSPAYLVRHGRLCRRRYSKDGESVEPLCNFDARIL